jgi:hypothetical protein
MTKLQSSSGRRLRHVPATSCSSNPLAAFAMLTLHIIEWQLLLAYDMQEVSWPHLRICRDIFLVGLLQTKINLSR